MACILLWSSAVRVHASQAYWKIDVTRERMSRILQLREMLLSIQTGFSLVNVAVFCAILESISGLESSSVITEPSLRILCEKYLQHQQDLYHVFIDFKKAFDMVWHAALWATMKKYNISTNLIQVIKNLYSKATSAVLFNNSIGDWFRTTVGVRQGYLLSPTLFSIFLERIMTDTLEDHEGTVGIG